MNDLAIITLSYEGLATARRLNRAFSGSSLHAYNAVTALDAEPFNRLSHLLKRLWTTRKKIVVFAPIGAVVRSLANNIESKYTDPAIVVADIYGRWIIPILSSHEGGANKLAFDVANILGSEPVITTTKEATKNIIVGIGCRRNVLSNQIVNAIHKALGMVGLSISQVRLVASICLKMEEKGLLEAANYLKLPLRFIPREDILSSPTNFSKNRVVI